jgi:fumarate hydratase class I
LLKLRDGIVELYKKAATSIPNDIEAALRDAFKREDNPIARDVLGIILDNISIARTTARPICQDTGFPVFYIQAPKGLSHALIRDVIYDATRRATQKVPLRANAVDALTETNSGDNTGSFFPFIHLDETEDGHFNVELMLKGSGSENVGQTYKLPYVLEHNGSHVLAERNLEGVRRCVLDAVVKAQGRGCPPYVVGVAIGGSKEQTAFLSKKQLMRRLTDTNPEPLLAELERQLLEDINKLGIGVAGLGGNNTALSVKVIAAARHPASYFVDVSLGCWAMRRGRLIW